MGKGVALRSALRLADEKIGESDFYITADCDGQYSPEDIEKVAKELLENPDCFVLGVRTYERKKGKKVRFWLNSCQKLFSVLPIMEKNVRILEVDFVVFQLH